MCTMSDASPPPVPVDLLVLGGIVVTMDPAGRVLDGGGRARRGRSSQSARATRCRRAPAARTSTRAGLS